MNGAVNIMFMPQGEEARRERIRGMLDVITSTRREVHRDMIEANYAPLKDQVMVNNHTWCFIHANAWHRQMYIEHERYWLDNIIHTSLNSTTKEIYKGNAKKWSVLDDSYDEETRRKMQAAVKDDRTVEMKLPEGGTSTALQIQRAQFFVEDDDSHKVVPHPTHNVYI